MKKHLFLPHSRRKIDNIIGVKADVIEALQKEFSKNNVSVDIDASDRCSYPSMQMYYLTMISQN